MLCIPLGHAGALRSAQWLIRPSRVYSPDENREHYINGVREIRRIKWKVEREGKKKEENTIQEYPEILFNIQYRQNHGYGAEKLITQ